MVDQTVNMHWLIAANAVTSHVQDMGAYNKACMTGMLQQWLLPQIVQQIVTALFK